MSGKKCLNRSIMNAFWMHVKNWSRVSRHKWRRYLNCMFYACFFKTKYEVGKTSINYVLIESLKIYLHHKHIHYHDILSYHSFYIIIFINWSHYRTFYFKLMTPVQIIKVLKKLTYQFLNYWILYTDKH